MVDSQRSDVHDDCRTAIPVKQGDASARWLRQPLPAIPRTDSPDIGCGYPGTPERAEWPTTCSARFRLRMDRQQRHRWIFTGLNLVAIALMLYVTSRFTSSTPKQVSYSDFLTKLRAGNLNDVQITERELLLSRFSMKWRRGVFR